MTVTFCCCGTRKQSRRSIVLLLVGLDNAGKTTAANGLAKKEIPRVIPTVGFSTITLRHKGYNVMVYDLGGGPQIREIWSKYFNDIHGVIFVIDASDIGRLDESRVVLENLIRNKKIAEKPILVLANKQDKEGALDEIDITERLGIEQLVNEQKCPTRVEITSVYSAGSKRKTVDSRLLSGYRWLLGQIIKNYDELNRRVIIDVHREKEEHELRLQAWRKLKEEKENSKVSKKGSEVSVRRIPVRPKPDSAGSKLELDTSSSSTDMVICNGIKHEVISEVHTFKIPTVLTTELQECLSTSHSISEQLRVKSAKQKKKSLSARGRRKGNKVGPEPSTSDQLTEWKELEQSLRQSRPTTTRSLGRTGKAWDMEISNVKSTKKVDKSTNIF